MMRFSFLTFSSLSYADPCKISKFRPGNDTCLEEGADNDTEVPVESSSERVVDKKVSEFCKRLLGSEASPQCPPTDCPACPEVTPETGDECSCASDDCLSCSGQNCFSMWDDAVQYGRKCRKIGEKCGIPYTENGTWEKKLAIGTVVVASNKVNTVSAVCEVFGAGSQPFFDMEGNICALDSEENQIPIQNAGLITMNDLPATKFRCELPILKTNS